MRNEASVSKMGNNLAIRIPQAIAKRAGLNEGDSVALALDSNGAIVLRPTRRKYKLAELVARITPKNRHQETDWASPDGGRRVDPAQNQKWKR
jgi:antitoxin MazE